MVGLEGVIAHSLAEAGLYHHIRRLKTPRMPARFRAQNAVKQTQRFMAFS